MTVYISNENGDWWEYVPASVVYVIDTESPQIKEALASEEVEIGEDKFEDFIIRYGQPVDIAKGAYKWD